VTVLVDAAAWPWRGRRWAHLCSDSSLEELHAFAAAIGVRRVAFQGDHYDIDAAQRVVAVAAGAVVVDSRDLLRRLRDAGLRGDRRRGAYTWRTVGVFASTSDLLERALRSLPPHAPSEVVDAVVASVGSLVDHHGPDPWDARVLHRPGELAVLWRGGGKSVVPADAVRPVAVLPVEAVWPAPTAPAGRLIVEFFAPLPRPR